MFSPYYAWARRGGAAAEATRHVAVNVLLGGRPRRWTMTERGEAALEQDPAALRIGPSSLAWDGTALTVAIRERSLLGQGLRGTVRVIPSALTGFSATLDAPGRHRWRPMAPRARVEVALDRPGLRWSGAGYLDSNDGDEPLETGFRRWDWCRAPLAAGRTAIFYDTYPVEGAPRGIAITAGPDGIVRPVMPPPLVRLPRSATWRLTRLTRAERGAASVRATLLDSPFYVRSVLDSQVDGQAAIAMHESLDMARFSAPWIQAMLPFRMPRRARA